MTPEKNMLFAAPLYQLWKGISTYILFPKVFSIFVYFWQIVLTSTMLSYQCKSKKHSLFELLQSNSSVYLIQLSNVYNSVVD